MLAARGPALLPRLSLLARALHASAPLQRGTKHLDWFFRAARARELAPLRAPLRVFPDEPLHGRQRKRVFIDFAVGGGGGGGAGSGAATGAAAPAAAATAAPAAAVAAASAPAVVAPAAAPALTRVVVELADDVVPVTVANFLALAAAPHGAGYVGGELFKAQKGFAIFVGDARAGREGRLGHSSFRARYFPDENFIGRHAEPGVLAMASAGVHSNASVFYITLAKAPHLGA
jgi:cyclophilin family peptidyl-prolyl cis-trans isomerase